jgi:hypothetical protein
MGSPATYCKDETVKPGWPEGGWQWVRCRQPGNLTTLWDWQLLARGATIKRGPRGLFLGEGYRFGLPVAGAFTVGNDHNQRHGTDAQPQSPADQA